ALQVWVYTALPELVRRQFKEAILSQLEDFPDDLIIIHIFYLLQTRVINFVQKDISQMFPKWEFDVEDTPAENIIKLMFKNVVKEDSLRPRKKARKEAPAEASEGVAAEASEEVTTTVGGLTKEDIKTMFKDIADTMREGFGTCLKEIKYLSERVEAVEKKVDITTKWKGTSSQNTTSPHKPTLEPGLHLLCFLYCMDFIYVFCFIESVNGTNAGRKSLAEYKGPDVPAAVPAGASSSKDKAPEPSLEDARYQEKRDAALALFRAKSDRTRKLAASQQSPYTANSTARVIIPNKKLYPGYNPFAPIDKKKLKELADWLKTCQAPIDKKPHDLPISHLHIDACINVLRKRYNANPQHFRSERMCFLDHLFAQQWRFNFKDFKDSEPDQNGLGRRLPVNFADTHWIAMWISIPKRHIVVFDSICSSISSEELDVVMESFLYMVPYLLVECASSDEQRAQYSLEPFTYERPTNIPPARAGDCDVYTLNKKNFAKANGKTVRDKMAVDIFQELPDAHEFENKDNDDNLGAYDELIVKSSGMLDDLTISSLESLMSSDLL
ncbi:unnamed protein product, partial [Brassica oleracea]